MIAPDNLTFEALLLILADPAYPEDRRLEIWQQYDEQRAEYYRNSHIEGDLGAYAQDSSCQLDRRI